MKKLFFTLVAAMMAATATFAQSTLVATLTHGENVTMFYGTYALHDAHNAAVSGDIINLSGGGFQPVDITKAITLRGVGIDDALPTKITSGFNINTPSDGSYRLTMEGVRCESVNVKGSSNPYFLKCCFSSLSVYDSSNKVMIVNCKVLNAFYLGGYNSCQILNSYIKCYYCNDNSQASVVNCILEIPSSSYIGDFRNTQLLNCIAYCTGNHGGRSIQSTSIANNCIAINCSSFFNNSQTNPNCNHSTYAEIFKSFTGGYSDTETFELTDEAKTKYLGTDGTQIGLYGGLMPYTSIPSYPRITKMNVASKTTADGKLSVDIEVSAAQ